MMNRSAISILTTFWYIIMIFNDGQRYAETILGKESIMEPMTKKNLSLLFPCALLCNFLKFILKFSLNQLPVSCYLQSKMATTLQSQPLKPTNRFFPTEKNLGWMKFFPTTNGGGEQQQKCRASTTSTSASFHGPSSSSTGVVWPWVFRCPKRKRSRVKKSRPVSKRNGGVLRALTALTVPAVFFLGGGYMEFDGVLGSSSPLKGGFVWVRNWVETNPSSNNKWGLETTKLHPPWNFPYRMGRPGPCIKGPFYMRQRLPTGFSCT